MRLGIDIPSDGEFGKRGWYQYLSDRLAGLEYSDTPDTSAQYPSRDRTRFPEFYEMYERIERRPVDPVPPPVSVRASAQLFRSHS